MRLIMIDNNNNNNNDDASLDYNHVVNVENLKQNYNKIV